MTASCGHLRLPKGDKSDRERATLAIFNRDGQRTLRVAFPSGRKSGSCLQLSPSLRHSGSFARRYRPIRAGILEIRNVDLVGCLPSGFDLSSMHNSYS